MHLGAGCGALGQAVVHPLHHRRDRLQLARLAVQQPTDAALGLAHQLHAAAAVRGEPIVHHRRADLDQLPQPGLVGHDLGIGPDVRRRRRGAGQLQQVGTLTHLVQLAARLEPLADGHRVEGLLLGGQLGDGPENQLVVAAVEVLGRHHVRHVPPGPRHQHQPAQHGLLGVDAVRGNTGALRRRGRLGAGVQSRHPLQLALGVDRRGHAASPSAVTAWSMICAKRSSASSTSRFCFHRGLFGFGTSPRSHGSAAHCSK